MYIRNKVIISLLNRGDVLLSEGYDSLKDFRYYIPVGGGVEFGESLVDAARREVQEELGISVSEFASPSFHENLFEYEGSPGHEMVFHFMCHIADHVRRGLPGQGQESNGESFQIVWFSKQQLEDIKSSIVPHSIYDEIKRAL